MEQEDLAAGNKAEYEVLDGPVIRGRERHGVLEGVRKMKISDKYGAIAAQSVSGCVRCAVSQCGSQTDRPVSECSVQK